VELLVVVAILAVLLSVLLPGLQHARAQAQTAVCGTHLREIALANALYAGDHEYRYCPGAANFVTRNLHRWHGTRQRPSEPFTSAGGPLTPYLGPEGRIRACPGLPGGRPSDGTRGFERNCGGYGYNLAYLGRELDSDASGLCRVVTDLHGARVDAVRHPEATLMFADSAFVSGEPVEYSFAEPRYFPVYGTRADPSVHFRHRRWANVAWADGHVDRRQMTFTWRSGLYPGDPGTCDVGWFGRDDDNSLFDLD
jgi:prepilin-type processing-associated H-X9-DG protein